MSQMVVRLDYHCDDGTVIIKHLPKEEWWPRSFMDGHVPLSWWAERDERAWREHFGILAEIA